MDMWCNHQEDNLWLSGSVCTSGQDVDIFTTYTLGL